MRIFIAGGTGAIGSLLVPMLVEAGHEVVGSSRSAHGVRRLREQGAEGVVLDVFDRDATIKTLGAAAPQVVVHQLTSLGDGNFAEHARIRREGTRNLVDAAQQAGVTRVVAQSIAWAYQSGSAPAAEQTPLDTATADPSRERTVGAVAALEETVAEIDEHVNLRFGLFYGPGTWYAPGGSIAAQIADGTLPADDAVSSFVHVSDAARATVLALGWPSGAVNIVDDEPAPARDWVPVLAAAQDVPLPGGPASAAAGWARGADNSLARSPMAGARPWPSQSPNGAAGL